MRARLLIAATLLAVFGCVAAPVHAQEEQTAPQAPSAEAGQSHIERAKVLTIISQDVRNVPGTETPHSYQTLTALIENGPDKGATVRIENDYLNLKVGEEFYVTHDVEPNDGTDTYTVNDPYRLPSVLGWIVLLIVLTIVFGGKQGIRGLLSLVISVAAILFVLLPGILHGYSPILLAIGISSIIVVVSSYVTHGFSKTTTAAVIGMIIAVAVTGILAYIAVMTTHLSGFTNEDAAYLNFQTEGGIDFVSLLLGGIMIGMLGIMYDAAIGQAVAIEELSSAAEHLSHGQIFKRAMRIGREHIGALINTLAIAYVGASLPLLLLLHFSNMTLGVTLNQEIFASEIIRTVIGSIGLILAVPITTYVSTWLLVKPKQKY